MKETERFYMHTLDGRPAFFQREQIVFAEQRDHWQDDYPVVVMRRLVAEIREDQEKHIAFRKRHGWEVGKLDYVIVSLTAGVIPWRTVQKPARRRAPARP